MQTWCKMRILIDKILPDLECDESCLLYYQSYIVLYDKYIIVLNVLNVKYQSGTGFCLSIITNVQKQISTSALMCIKLHLTKLSEK